MRNNHKLDCNHNAAVLSWNLTENEQMEGHRNEDCNPFILNNDLLIRHYLTNQRIYYDLKAFK